MDDKPLLSTVQLPAGTTIFNFRRDRQYLTVNPARLETVAAELAHTQTHGYVYVRVPRPPTKLFIGERLVAEFEASPDNPYTIGERDDTGAVLVILPRICQFHAPLFECSILDVEA
jgi:hypothetical protein